VRYIGTPRGGTHWYSKLECATFRQSTLSNPHISDEYKRSLVAEYRAFGEDYLRQELFGDPIDADSGGSIISLFQVAQAKRAEKRIDLSEPIIWGFDVGRSIERDPSVLVARQGKVVLWEREFRIRDSVELAEEVANLARHQMPNALIVDAHEFMGHLPANDAKCANKRAHSYLMARDWLNSGGSLTNCDHWGQLAWANWQSNKKGQIILEPKEIIRSREGSSPDYADAFTMTFYAEFSSLAAKSLNPYAIQGEF